MDVWHPYSGIARRGGRDAIERWASLESKSETMRHDLIGQFEKSCARESRYRVPLALLTEAMLALISTLMHLRNR